MNRSPSPPSERRPTASPRVGLATAFLMSGGLSGCVPPMAVSIEHSPVAYTRPSVVAPTPAPAPAGAPLPKTLSVVAPPPAPTRPLSGAGHPGSADGEPASGGGASASGDVSRDEGVVIVPGYTLPSYGPAAPGGAP